MSRFTLLIKATLFRFIKSILGLGDLYLSTPIPQRSLFTRKIPSTVGSVPGTFKLLFFTSSSYQKSPSTTAKKHPILINFHGGGFTIGNAGDDARWASAVAKNTNAVVISVNYRLAPEYPFPTGIEDCVSAVLWVWKHAEEYNLDISRTSFSGFSAGGNFTFTVAIRLYEELKRVSLAERGVGDAKLVSLVPFYAAVDWTKSREERDATNPSLIRVVPAKLFKLFDESYLYPPPIDMYSPLISPAKASDELLREALPDTICMIICGGDQLWAESLVFKKRLLEVGKRIDGYVVPGVGHSWDKKPSYSKGNKKRDEAYEVAIESLRRTWGLES